MIQLSHSANIWNGEQCQCDWCLPIKEHFLLLHIAWNLLIYRSMSYFECLLIFLIFSVHQTIWWSYLNAQFLCCFKKIILHFPRCIILASLSKLSPVSHLLVCILLTWIIDFLFYQNLKGLLQIHVRYLKMMEILIFFCFFHYFHYS